MSVNAVFDLYLWPFHRLSATWQVCALGVPAAVLALLVYRFTSNQSFIERTKDKIKAHLLELLLFKDDLGVMLRAHTRILRYSLTYMRLALVPMAVMIVPFILFLIQIESRFAFRSLDPGEITLLSAMIDHGGPASRLSADLILPPALVQETPPLRVDATGEVLWRLRAATAGEYQIEISINGETLKKRVVIGNNRSPVSPAVYRENDVRTILYPMESALKSDASARTIRLNYPRARSSFAGLSSASWIFFGMTLLFGFTLRGVFQVTF